MEEENKVSSEEVTSEVHNNVQSDKPNKKGISPIVLLIVCVVAFAIGFTLSFVVGKDKNKDKETDKKSNEVTSNEVSNKSEESNKVESNSNETKTEDNTLTSEEKNTITKKYAMLFGMDKFSKYIPGGMFDLSGYLFEQSGKEFNKSALDAIEVLANYKDMKLDPSKFAVDTEQLYIKKGNIFTAVTLDEMNKNYKYVFGKDIDQSVLVGKTVDDDYSTGCVDVTLYDRNLKVFVKGPAGCGGAGFISNLFYADNIVKENGDIIVKVYVGSEESNEHKDNIYNDSVAASFDEGTVRKSAVKVKAKGINESNKKQFTLYNFIFKKASDGNYYFDSVKKAS